MIYKRGLIQKYKKVISQSEWYNQRFDGSPHFLGMLSISHFTKSKRKPKGMHFTDLVGIYSRGVSDWYINMKDIKRITKIFIEKSKQGDNIGKKLVVKWEKDEKYFYDKCSQLEDLDVSKSSNQQILKHYQELKNIYLGWFSMSSIIDGFALGSDNYIHSQIDKLLESKRVKKGKGKIFSQLTAPIGLSFSKEAELSLLRITNKIRLVPKLKRDFQKLSVISLKKEIKDNYLSIYKLLEEHQNNFFWLRNNYINWKIIDIKEFIIEIRDLLKDDTKKRLEKLKLQLKITKKDKEKIFKKFKFPQYLRNLIEISEVFTFWQDRRKRSTLFAIHYFCLLLEVVAQRTEYTLEDLKFFTTSEIVSLLKNEKGHPDKKNIQKRKKYSLFYHRGNSYEYYLEKRAKKLFQQIFKKNKKIMVNDFRGITASPGIEVGKARIVKTVQDINKIKSGDILVSIMTRPDYMVGIKKASAIVTDEGGITCHAAIVSRELGIPCVIATKNATQILNDGDLVQVDADHGVVKILNKR